MRSFVDEFKEFVNRGNLLDLAIAVILATAFAPVIDALANGVIMNLVAAVFGQPSFDSIIIEVGDGALLVGAVVTALINFAVVAFVCFLIVRSYNRMQKPQVEEAAAVTETDLLVEIRDELRRRPSS